MLLPLQVAQQAELARLRGNLTQAARLAGAAAAVEDRLNRRYQWDFCHDLWPAFMMEYRQYLTAVRALLDDPELATAWAEGERMTLDQAVACALQEGTTREDRDSG